MHTCSGDYLSSEHVVSLRTHSYPSWGHAPGVSSMRVSAQTRYSRSYVMD